LIIKRALSLVAAIVAMAAAAAVCVVAAAYALYALLRYSLGPAGASAAIAVIFAVVAAVLAFVAFRKTQPHEGRHPRVEDQSLATRLIDLAREKPIIAAGAVAAAGLVVLRNPGVVTTLITAALANKAGKAEGVERRDRRR
jgi:zinc transporter ZupT